MVGATGQQAATLIRAVPSNVCTMDTGFCKQLNIIEGSFDISDSLTVSEIEELKRADKLEEAFISIDQVLEFLSCVHVALEHEKKVLNGMPVQKQDIRHISKDFLSGNKILIKNQRGDLLAIGEALVSSVDLPEIGDNDPVFRPKKILV